jgi:hypothetical protein
VIAISRIYIFVGFVTLAAMAKAEPFALAPDVIVRNFCTAMQEQQRSVAAMSMEVDIEASLPKLKKHGRLHALRRISTLGRVTYEALKFEGDGTVKNNVIARYLTAELQAQNDGTQSMALTPENYKFKYKGTQAVDGREVHVFDVTPKSKKVGLFKGHVWIDAATHLRLQESGYFVKSPSLFLKRVAFVRKYEIRDGVSIPMRISSVVETRLVGKAELNIAYSNVSLEDGRRVADAGGSDQ